MAEIAFRVLKILLIPLFLASPLFDGIEDPTDAEQYTDGDPGRFARLGQEPETDSECDDGNGVTTLQSKGSFSGLSVGVSSYCGN